MQIHTSSPWFPLHDHRRWDRWPKVNVLIGSAQKHLYERTHTNPTHMSIFKDWANKSSRLTKSSQVPRCRQECCLPLKPQTLLNLGVFASTRSRTQDLRCYWGSCNYQATCPSLCGHFPSTRAMLFELLQQYFSANEQYFSLTTNQYKPNFSKTNRTKV